MILSLRANGICMSDDCLGALIGSCREGGEGRQPLLKSQIDWQVDFHRRMTAADFFVTSMTAVWNEFRRRVVARSSQSSSISPPSKPAIKNDILTSKVPTL